MSWMRFLVPLLLLVCATVAGAQPQTPPDPAKLDADWWNYFILDGHQLRVTDCCRQEHAYLPAQLDRPLACCRRGECRT